MAKKNEVAAPVNVGALVEREGLLYVVVRASDAGLYLVPVPAPVPADECKVVG
jgi:hypothetical protein